MNGSYSVNILAGYGGNDCLLFKEDLRELGLRAGLTTAKNGKQLMKLLLHSHVLQDILFLDRDMLRKNGFESLSAIKQNEKLKTTEIISPLLLNQIL